MQSLMLAALQAVTALEESIEYCQVPAWSPSIERRRQALQALREAVRLGAEPSGWKLVPLTPTPTMIKAHDEVLQMVDRVWTPPPSITSSAYRAMLLSAPRSDLPAAGASSTGPTAFQTPNLRSAAIRPVLQRRLSL